MLRAEGVTKRYRTPRGIVTAIDNASLSLAPGARLGLVGASGSGKSTLGQLLALLLKPDTGTITVDNMLIRTWGVNTPRALRRQVQLIWQSPRLAVDPRLRIRQLFLEPLAANHSLPPTERERRALLERWAERVGLTRELLERFPHEVSEGQLQRACLARALILQPRYLVCDELSSMLDVSTQAALLETLAAEQRARSMAILLITHDRVLAQQWCDDLVQLGARPRERQTPVAAQEFSRPHPH